jgi:arylsulfatase A-like enzyme
MVADDLGWNDVGFHGSTIETPSLDRLAREGVELTRLYTNPICTPTRAALMTGRDPVEMGFAHSVIPPWSNVGIPLDEHFMSETFRDNGYQTGIIGKWHLGHHNQAQAPNARGFDYFYGNLTSGPDYFSHESRVGGLDWQRNGSSVVEEGYNTELIATAARQFLTGRDPERPFLLYIPWNAPHTPLQAPKRLMIKYVGEFNPQRIIFAAMTEAMDTGVGEILQALEDEGIADNTIVLFFSDNGGMPAVGGRNTPLRGGKGQTFEGGIRVPAIIRWPAKLAGAQNNDQVMNVYDLFPTLAAAADIEPDNDKVLDGVNLLSSLTEDRQVPHKPMFFAADTLTPDAIRYGVIRWPWKLVREEQRTDTVLQVREMLFQLEQDPQEQQDLAQEQLGIAIELNELLLEWKQRAPQHELRFNHFPHPGWAPPTDWNEALIDTSKIDVSFSKDKRQSQSLQLKLREKLLDWFDDSDT